MSNRRITVYLGDVYFFDEQLSEFTGELTDINEVIRALEASRNVMRLVGEDAETKMPDQPSFENIAVASSDFAILSDSSVSNFLGLLNQCNWMHVLVHNPPASVFRQLKRADDVEVISQNRFLIERKTIVDLHQALQAELVGQESAIESILSGIYSLTREGRNRPVVLMFYGPSGVGKTQAAQIIGNTISHGVLRKQFSMLHSDKFYSYVFGGSHSEASFARDLAERNSDVILLDEFDKCNPVFYSAFYELFDEGLFQDKNYEICLGSGIFICTTNFGSLEEIKKNLGEPIFSRFDRFIEFNSLGPSEILEVVRRMISNSYATLSPEERKVVDDERVREKLAAFNWSSGNVRQLKRYVDEAFDLALVRNLIADS
ncbi:ATP-binding protein [Corynebacterium diphtheriae]|uniref:AAA family ATPase n=1 Tax=Corynebacterium diphtheriae TaxID=1717 RepID=UPI000246950E|nr:AAA family ATPase [Corynebacterium diphtheriae]AEX84381.1 hypothetical protein CDVA01_2117 [Corynebacterium diphtheriae VA01]CAB0485963.1 ATP-binding protein [Corynebacterium diphtheriae]CAB0623848.1 ATP-binding protein [Corynebacterium diphtheriae]